MPAPHAPHQHREQSDGEQPHGQPCALEDPWER
jgi:hypothetical protein